MYYTYAYLREDGTPYYIGKGSNGRVYQSHRHIPVPNDKDKILFLKQNLTEEEAFKHEIYMIAIYGRKDLGTGILRNLTEGGEGTSGRIYSEETRKKISESKIGKTHTEESKRKMSNTLKGRIISKEHRKKLSESQSGKSYSKESRRKMSDCKPGEKNYWYGKTHTEETRKKISESKMGKTHSKESREKMSRSKGEIMWITNGSQTKMIKINQEIPIGFVRGRYLS